jgi:hypothetical protein
MDTLGNADVLGLQRFAGNRAVTGLVVQRDLVDDAAALVGGAGGVTASFLPGGTGDWHEIAQALTIIIAGVDVALAARETAPIAIREAGAVTTAGGDYGPQNAVRHCMFAGLLTSHAWRMALAELGMSITSLPGSLLMAAFGACMGLRVRLVLMAHEWFADDGFGNFGTGTVDSVCDQHNNNVGIDIGGPFTSDEKVLQEAKSALDSGRLLMTPGPTDLTRTVSTAGWRTSPWFVNGQPQQPVRPGTPPPPAAP